MEDEITLEQLIAWHRQRAQDIMSTMARATHVPKQQREAMTSMAKFHQVGGALAADVRVTGAEIAGINRRFSRLIHLNRRWIISIFARTRTAIFTRTDAIADSPDNASFAERVPDRGPADLANMSGTPKSPVPPRPPVVMPASEVMQ
jgi:hypothetical protein